MMISGDGFFVTSKGGQQLFTRAGAFSPDAAGQLVSPDGGILQGWTAVSGVVNTGGPVSGITLNANNLVPANATSSVTVDGNLPSDGAENTPLERVVKVYNASGAERNLTLTFTRAGNDWTVTGNDGSGATTTTLTQDASGNLTPANATLAVGGGITVNLGGISAFAGMTSLAVSGQDGSAAGKLESYTLGNDGSVIGSFSNGVKQVLAKIALAKFTNPSGLEKAGGSSYVATANSGGVQLGGAGDAGIGSLAAGSLEMSNVDLSQEFTNLIVAQRGFQANARIITTSDEVLQELGNLKR